MGLGTDGPKGIDLFLSSEDHDASGRGQRLISSGSDRVLFATWSLLGSQMSESFTYKSAPDGEEAVC